MSGGLLCLTNGSSLCSLPVDAHWAAKRERGDIHSVRHTAMAFEMVTGRAERDTPAAGYRANGGPTVGVGSMSVTEAGTSDFSWVTWGGTVSSASNFSL